MSNSELLHDKEELSNFEVLKRPKLKFQTECYESLSNISSDSQSQDQEKEDDIVLSKQSDSVACTTLSRVQNKVEDEDDGFRTPTSMDHRIPVAKQCPSAPRKPKPFLKRKPPCSCRHPLDLSKEVELLFPTQQKTLSNSHQSTKKVRRE